MPISYESKYDVINTSTTFHDLRHLSDDKTVLENPNKGWYYHLVDNSLNFSKYRDRLGEAHKLPIPISHMYIRFDWGDIEKEEGVLDWSEIDELMNSWGEFGYKFTFRICTYESPYLASSATPMWVFDSGVNYTKVTIGDKVGYEPDYSDPLFLAKLDAFLKKCAEKFDCDPRVKYIDIGTLGTWGEGHTYMGSNKLFPAETVMAHVKLHIKNFKNKLLVLNDDYIEIASRTSTEDASLLYDYALGKGLGFRDDSICVPGYVSLFGYDSLRRPTLFEQFAKNAPVDIELAHVTETTPEGVRGGLTAIEAIRRAHATYAGFHGYIDAWTEMCPYLTEYLANRLGYWFFIDGVDIGYPVAGRDEICKILVRNNGYSKCYDQYDLKLRARDKDGNVYLLNAKSPDSTRWESESVTEETLRLSFGNVPAGEYTLECGMLYENEPIKLAIKSDRLTDDGYYKLVDFTVEEI